MAGLSIAPGLDLPVDAATGTYGILATKGAGKSNAAVVLAEEMHDAGVPWVAVDPKGDWYGIRSSADGKGPGLPVVVFGGRHGDVPLEPTAGVLLAELVHEHRLSCVLDVSEFTKADVIRFLRAFGERLFRLADGEVLHLFLEEAHEYLPQRVDGEQAKMVEVWQRIVKQGRFKGLGCTLISQRSSVLNKDVLELVDTLIVLRTIGPRSRDSIRDWVRGQDVDEHLLSSLPSLRDGEAWVWSPGELGIMQRVQFRRRRTFDSGATPKVGEKRRRPATVADVDLVAIKDAMAATIEKAEHDDPRRLHAEIARLQRDLTAARAAAPEPELVQEMIPFTPPGVRDAVAAIGLDVAEELRDALEVMDGGLAALRRARDHMTALVTDAVKAMEDADAVTFDDRTPLPLAQDRAARRLPAAGGRPAGDGAAAERRVAAPVAPQRARPPARRDPGGDPGAGPAPDLVLKAGAKRMLEILAGTGMVLTRSQVAVQAKVKKSGGTFGTYWSTLKSNGLIDEDDTGAWATPAGIAFAGVAVTTPTTSEEMVAMWMDRLKDGARRILRLLVDHYPDWADVADVAAEAGISTSGGTWGTYLSMLATNGLIEVSGSRTTGRLRASPDIMITG